MSGIESGRAAGGQLKDWGREPMLLERDDEAAEIEAALAAARAGDGRAVVVEGPAGIGKTTLLELAVERARDAGFQVARATGVELERNFSFGLALQLFEPVLDRLGEGPRNEVLGGAAALAKPLLDGNLADTGDEHAFSVLHGLYWLTSNIADREPLALVVDDVQWGDRSTTRFLLYLLRRLEGLPVALIAGLRPGEQHADQDLLTELGAGSHASVIRPRSLSPGAVCAVARSTFFEDADEEFCEACARITEGNPFLLIELLRSLRDEHARPDAITARRLGQFAPDSVLRVVAARLARLPPEGAQLARAVAVLGSGGKLALAATLAGLEIDVAANALDALTQAELFAPDRLPRFTHPLVASSIHESIPPAKRAAAHCRAARLLADDGAHTEVVVGHVLMGHPSGDPWSVEQLRAAAAIARSRGAPESAVTLLRRALDEPPAADQRAEVMVELGLAEAAAGSPSGLEQIEQAVELLDDPDRRREVLALLGRRLTAVSRYTDAADVFERAIDVAPGAEDELQAELLAGYCGTARIDAPTRSRSIERLEALRAQRNVGSSWVERVVLSSLAFEQVTSGESRDEVVRLARGALDGPTPLWEASSDAVAVDAVAVALGYADEFGLAQEVLGGVMSRAQRLGLVMEYAQACQFRCHLLYREGRLTEAIADAESALALGGEPDLGIAGPGTLAVLAEARLDRGERAAAAEALAELPDEDRWRTTAPYAYLLAARARMRALEGDAGEAHELFRACGDLLERLHAPNPTFISWRSGAALALRERDPESASALARDELALAERFGAPRAISISLRAVGVIEGGAAGVELLRRAVQVLEGSKAALARANALFELGSALRRTDDREAAREQLRRALDEAAVCGAFALSAAAEAELRATGARPRRRAAAGADSLTPSERRTAELAAQGMSNKEIAQAQFVTVKAVEWHLGNTYRKLGIASRQDLAAALSGSATGASADGSRNGNDTRNGDADADADAPGSRAGSTSRA